MRVPVCPDCGEPAMSTDKDEWFRCICGSIWKENGWMKKIDAEEKMAKERVERDKILSLLAMGDNKIQCDSCGYWLRHAEKYCFNTDTQKRYCKKCSINRGYLFVIENRQTGERIHAMIFASHERQVFSNDKLGEYESIIKTKNGSTCLVCHEPLYDLFYDVNTHGFNASYKDALTGKIHYYLNTNSPNKISVCNNSVCKAFRMQIRR